jgi:4-hydroxy-tetrahydrodipicolinate reductase
MKIALIGYGKMGKEIEKIALLRNHEIVLTIDKDNLSDMVAEKLSKADVAIEFTMPQAALENYQRCFEANVPVVTGTTGWLDKLPEIEKICAEKKKTFFYASNFSLGVNLFFELNRVLARMMKNFGDYNVSMEETHHTQKLDAPSGTAISLANDLLSVLDQKAQWVNEPSPNAEDLCITSVRRDNVPGIHTVKYESPVDFIEITHSAHNRQGFALGAVLAAEFVIGKTGVFTMSDLLQLGKQQ